MKTECHEVRWIHPAPSVGCLWTC